MAYRTHVALLLGLAASTAFAQTSGKKAESAGDAQEQVTLAQSAAPAMVIVEYTLRYDKGEAPQGVSMAEEERNPYRYQSNDLTEVIKDERPFEQAGYLADATHVVTRDLQMDPRFIKSIAVRRYGAAAADPSTQRATATISAYPQQHNAVILTLDKALPGASVPAFAPQTAGPYAVVRLQNEDAQWRLTVAPLGGAVTITGDKKTFAAPAGLVVSKEGVPLTISTGDDLPVGEGWRVAPLSWPATSAEQLAAMTAKIDQAAQQGIVRATLNFRSPKAADPRQQMLMGTDEQNTTVQEALAVTLEGNRVLVLVDLKPTLTARLERIHLNTTPPIDAHFQATLSDFGALVATTDKPLEKPFALATDDLRPLEGTLLPAADIELQGEQRIATFAHRRIMGFHLGLRNGTYPEIPGQDKSTFLFTPGGGLLVLPVARRAKAATAERYTRDDLAIATPAADLAAAIKNLPSSADPANVPLSEEQENRLAWVGVELQPLSPELARANKVADQTSDGETGAVVTYVYPDSPAGKAGVEPGWILLRIHAASQPKPIDVRLDADPYGGESFPWDRLGEASEAVFDRIPSPWPPVENSVTRTLTDLGFGSKYSIEFFHDGKLDSKDFTVVQGPASYASAAHFKSVPLGITVRDLTYEVRRYLQKKPDEPGVVVAKIEQGSKASVAGLKPFELITHVNDQPVKDVKDFEKLTAGQTEIRLSVKRMTAGRIVKISLDAPAPTSKPATPGAAPGQD